MLRLTGRQGPKRVVFLYAEENRNSGSTVMRGGQLHDIAKEYLKDSRDISYLPKDHTFLNSILFLTKGVLKSVTQGELETLKKNGNIIIYDPVDSWLKTEIVDYADIILAASRMAFEDYKQRYPQAQVMLLDHHVDPRIALLDWTKKPKVFKAGYFGEIANTYMTSAIEEKVDYIQVDTFRQENSWLDKLPLYNFHYAIRQSRSIDHYKPFLKGFTAAACGANILIQDSQKEALLWLGKEYPFILKGAVTEKKILDMLYYGKQTFGSSEWRRAVKIMESITSQTSKEAISKQLSGILNRADQV